MSLVSLHASRDSFAGTQKALQPFRSLLAQKLSSLREVVVKVNFVSAGVELAATPTATVEAFLVFLRSFYRGKVVIAEESSLGSATEAFAKYGYHALVRKYPPLELRDTAKDKGREVMLRFSRGNLRLTLAETYLTSPFTVSICRAKTHDTVVVTLSIKNLLVGAIQGALRARAKIHQGRHIHQILVALAEYVYPSFAVIDATVGMEGDGPVDGTPKPAGWIVASPDALAADTLATYLMGFSLEDVGYLSLLAEGGKKGEVFRPGEGRVAMTGNNPRDLRVPFIPHRTFPLSGSGAKK
jgi:uncharacterized protein (DUF362 family)